MTTARPTMQQVAAAAGVSMKTVSRVVNGEDGVRPDTAARVSRAISALGFRRNELARSLVRGQRAGMIGLIVGDITNPFFAALAKTVDREAGDRGYAAFITSSDEDPARERELVEAFSGRRVDGLLLVPGGADHQYLLPELVRGTPVVFVDRPGNGVRGDAVTMDNAGGARKAVGHLLEHGHRRIGILVAPSYYTTQQRLLGYRQELRDAGVTVDESLVLTLPEGSVAAAEAGMAALLDRPDPPTAVFTTTNFVTIGALRALKARGARVGLVGFDDLAWSDLFATPVTVVAHEPSDMGRRAVHLLFDRLDGADPEGHPDGAPVRHEVLPAVLVDRGSGRSL